MALLLKHLKGQNFVTANVVGGRGFQAMSDNIKAFKTFVQIIQDLSVDCFISRLIGEKKTALLPYFSTDKSY